MFRSIVFLALFATLGTVNADQQFTIEADVSVTDFLASQTYETAIAVITLTVDPAIATETVAPMSSCTDLVCSESSQWQGGITAIDYLIATADGATIAEGSLTAEPAADNLAAAQQQDRLDGQPDSQVVAYYYRETTADLETILYVGWVSNELGNVDNVLAFPGIERSQDVSAGSQFSFSLNSRPNGEQLTNFDALGVVTAAYPLLSPDSDGDGFADAEDACMTSSDTSTVMVGGVDSRVPNILLGDGCTITDLMDIAVEETQHHGEFVREVTLIAKELVKEGAIDSRERYLMIKAALKSKKPHASEKPFRKELKKLPNKNTQKGG